MIIEMLQKVRGELLCEYKAEIAVVDKWIARERLNVIHRRRKNHHEIHVDLGDGRPTHYRKYMRNWFNKKLAIRFSPK